MSKYNPGPWTVENTGNTLDIVAGETLIADAYPDTIENYEAPTYEQAAANAALIAQAPDLLRQRDAALDALEPLAALASHYDNTEENGPCFIQEGKGLLKLTGADCHRARKALRDAGRV